MILNASLSPKPESGRQRKAQTLPCLTSFYRGDPLFFPPESLWEEPLVGLSLMSLLPAVSAEPWVSQLQTLHVGNLSSWSEAQKSQEYIFPQQ